MEIKNLLIIGAIIFIVGCTLTKDGTLRDNQGEILFASKSEIAKSQRILLNEQMPDNLPDSAEGGVLFDGKVISVNISPNGLYSTLFDVDKILFGEVKEKKRIVVYSPSPEKTGIDFKEGEVYRVFSIYLEGAYRTWDWMGTVKLSVSEKKKENIK